MKKVLLISINRCIYPYPVYPLGVSHVAAALISKGFSVRLCDMGIHNDQLETVIREFEPDIVGLSMRNVDDIRIDNTVWFIPELQNISKRVRGCSKAPVIVGGSAYSLFPEILLDMTGADYGIVSEGEVSFVHLLQLLSKNRQPTADELTAIPGLVYKIDSVVKQNPARPIDPKEIPPAFRDGALESFYRENSGVINVQTQRGCPCKCCYCTYPLIEGSIPRYRPAEKVVDEILESKARGNNYFFFVDSVFNTSKEHVLSICQELIRRDANISWSCFLKPSNLSEYMVELMAQSGLRHIEFGSDSFSDSVLREYGKDFSFEDIYNASEWARKFHINYAHFLITGGPGETEDTLNEAFDNSLRLKKTVIFPFTGMRLYPRTKLYNRAIDEGVTDPENDCLAPVFYVSPLISRVRINELLRRFHELKQNWILDDVPPEAVEIMSKLRKKGIHGPLWEFLVR